MRTCLLHAPACLMIQIDRMHMTADGTLQKCHCQIDLDATCSFPVFRGKGVSSEYADYVVVTAITHLGADQAGHCRAAMRTQPAVLSTGMPSKWLLTEDGMCPTPQWCLPDWFLNNVVLLGLVRADCRTLHLCKSVPTMDNLAAGTETTAPSDPASEILQLCQNMPSNMP